QALHQAAAGGIAVLAVDDLVADVQRAQLLEHLLLALVGLALDALPGRFLDLAAELAPRFAGRLRAQLAHLVEELVALALQLVDLASGVDDRAADLGYLF